MNIDWVTIPELILVEIFSNLPFRDRFNASLVCRNWSHIFQTAKLWHRITINDDWFNKTVPIQIDEDDVIVPSPILDYDRATKYLFSVGHHVRSIVIEPMDNFNLLYQFLTLIDWFIEQKNEKAPNIQEFIFRFPCQKPVPSNVNGIKYFEIGGQINVTLKKLLSKITSICHLILTDLVLERYEANSLMDKISLHLNRNIKKLSLVNLTIQHCPLHQLEMFDKLESLELSPQNLDENVIKSIANSNLKDLYIIQNEFTPKTVMSCKESAWIDFKKINKSTKIHLVAWRSLIIQPGAPVYSVKFYDALCSQLNQITENYFESIVNYSEITAESTKYCDNDLIRMASKCHRLISVTTTQPITTAALLILEKVAKSLKIIYIKDPFVSKYDDSLEAICRKNDLDLDVIKRKANSIENTLNEIAKSRLRINFLS